MKEHQAPATACTVCAGTQVDIFVSIPRVPVLCNVLWNTREEACSVARVDIELAFCHGCGHIFNPRFDLGLMDYTQVYENSLHYSPRFQAYADDLAASLVARHQLHGKNIVEIGSGKGDFLEMLCELGDNRGYGFDPSYVPGETERSRTDSVTFIQDFYSVAYADYPADFICCRHTLEHIPQPREFLQMLRRTIGDRTDLAVFFEVPNALATLRGLAIWDIIYEHCSYYTKYSLGYLFAQAGFEVTAIEEVYDGQFLTIEAVPADGVTIDAQVSWNQPSLIAEDISSFADRYRELLGEMQLAGRRGAIWGAGSKGITFLNILDPGQSIPYAVDINPRKQGKFVTGTGQEIVEPAALAAGDIDRIFVMNSIYLDEIRAIVQGLGVDAELLSV
jgi:SAM-dependent methyltransferase